MKNKVYIVGHSLSPQSAEIITVLATFPRIILSEINTHRMLSKNTSSSRAIPFEKMLEAVQNNPFTPFAWQKEILYICRKIKQCIFTKQRIYSMVNFI